VSATPRQIATRPMETDIPGAFLLHPLVLAAIAVFIVNDHVLKPAYHGWLTGKLSDVAGLIFFPVLAAAIAEVVIPTARRHLAVALALAVALTGLTFLVMLLVPAGADAYRWFFGFAQWPFQIVTAVLTGAPVPAVTSVFFAADRTDLITLPALLVPLAVAIRTAYLCRRNDARNGTRGGRSAVVRNKCRPRSACGRPMR
jgi:hypothetical protein